MLFVKVSRAERVLPGRGQGGTDVSLSKNLAGLMANSGPECYCFCQFTRLELLRPGLGLLLTRPSSPSPLPAGPTCRCALRENCGWCWGTRWQRWVEAFAVCGWQIRVIGKKCGVAGPLKVGIGASIIPGYGGDCRGPKEHLKDKENSRGS